MNTISQGTLSPTCPGHYNNPVPNPVSAAAAARPRRRDLCAGSDWPGSWDPLLPAPHRSKREGEILHEGAEETTRSPIGRRLRASLRAQWSVPARSRLSSFRPSLPLLPRCLLRLLFPCFLIGAFVMALFFWPPRASMLPAAPFLFFGRRPGFG